MLLKVKITPVHIQVRGTEWGEDIFEEGRVNANPIILNLKVIMLQTLIFLSITDLND